MFRYQVEMTLMYWIALQLRLRHDGCQGRSVSVLKVSAAIAAEEGCPTRTIARVILHNKESAMSKCEFGEKRKQRERARAPGYRWELCLGPYSHVHSESGVC